MKIQPTFVEVKEIAASGRYNVLPVSLEIPVSYTHLHLLIDCVLRDIAFLALSPNYRRRHRYLHRHNFVHDLGRRPFPDPFPDPVSYTNLIC